MQIHLKQLEIEAALRMFIASQGISLTSKVVEVAFTSGRKDNGLSAEITIEDSLDGATNSCTNQAVMPVDATLVSSEEVAPKPTTSLFAK